MRGAYKCMCECIDKKSFAELPFQPVQPAIPGPANPGPANPGPANPGPANPGPATEAPTEAPTTGGRK